MRIAATLCVALVLVLFPVGLATAQTVNPSLVAGTSDAPNNAAQTASPEEMRELLRLLGNPAIIDELRRTLEQQGDGAESGWSLRSEISAAAIRIETRVGALIAGFSAIHTIPAAASEALESGLDPGDALRVLTYVLIFLFIGGGLEWLYHQYARPLRLRLAHGVPSSLSHKVTRAGLGIVFHFTGVAIFAAGSAGAFVSFDWPTLTREMVITLLLVVVAFRLIGMLVSFILAPGAPDVRLVPLGNRRARRAASYIIFSALVGAAGIVIADGLRRLGINTGYEEELAPAVIVIPVMTAFLFGSILVGMIWRLRQPLADDYADAHPAPASRQMAIVNTVLIGVAFLLWLIGAHELMWTIVILGLLFPAIRTARTVVGDLFDQAEAAAEKRDAADEHENGVAEEEVAVQASMAEDAPPVPDDGQAISVDRSRYGTRRVITIRIVRIVLILLSVVALAWAWGLGLVSLTGSPSVGGRVFRTGVNVLVTLLLADLVWIWAKTAINRRLADYGPANDGMAPGPEARMATLLPILRMFLMITIAIIVILTVLSSIGINIGPLLAGAGVAGIAIGFGAQALVKDVVSGIFFLLDDAFRVGEYIEMENLRGTVESMSLRSLRIRHHRGAIHTIPFGELKAVTNHMRDWVIMKLEFRVPFETDLRLVKKIVKRIGAELQVHEGYGHHILQPLKSQGVRRMEEFNMVVGVKFMARPGSQWLIRRDAYQKLRDEFEKNGINFAQRDVKVRVESDKPLTPEEMDAVAGAAHQAIEQPAGPPKPVPDEP